MLTSTHICLWVIGGVVSEPRRSIHTGTVLRMGATVRRRCCGQDRPGPLVFRPLDLSLPERQVVGGPSGGDRRDRDADY